MKHSIKPTSSSENVKGTRATSSAWLAPNEAKRWTECFFLAYSPVWIVGVLCILVPFKLYESLDEWGYMAIGVTAALPCFTFPAFFVESLADANRPLAEKYWVKANVWIGLFSFIGNYFWTHYFYDVLGAKYTFPAHRLNNVPITLFFMTHAYFCLYHALANVVIRRTRAAVRFAGPTAQLVAEACLIFVLAYATAFAETLTIAHFPYYTFTNKAAMYRTGSLFYAIYFFVSFPMFFRMDEDPAAKPYSLWRAAVDALAAAMLVTCLLDFWRLFIGSIDASDHATPHDGLPWATS
jgi:cycloeucalenol cycloisomerase